MRFTRFERSATGIFHYPDIRIGVALSVLLAGRIIYRMVELYAVSPTPNHIPAPPLQSPLTFLFLGLLAGYYIAYYAGVLARSLSDGHVA